MYTTSTDRVTRPQPERPVQQAKPAQNNRPETADPYRQPIRSVQEAKADASRNTDKGRHVDRYA
jgi:hypothetical protein